MIACPACLAPVFAGMNHCPACGAVTAREERPPVEGLSCPRCRGAVSLVNVGAVELLECAPCGGVWMFAADFERLLADQEAQAAVIAWRAEAERPARPDPVRYAPCVRCGKLMNRLNFARVSGVIVDVCHDHGTWFDREELGRVVRFVQEGGLSKSRAAEVERLREEQRRHKLTLAATPPGGRIGYGGGDRYEPATGDLLVALLRLFT